ncbi:gas vesicle protein [Streptomyces sp. NPDC002734]|uniref:gas vesicle protein n=1 Tax=Streptomyces sp. NPDC002734 TaxID=3154426 RepID=UPI0033188215
MNEEQPRLPARQATGSPGAQERWPGSFGTPPRVAANARALEPRRDGEGSLAHVVETLLDKGLVLNADIMVSVAGVELLGIRLRAALASFETASRYGLEFPAGTDTDTAAWREAKEEKEACPQCDKKVPTKQLLEEWCPWCGWRSAQALATAEQGGDATAQLERTDNPGESERPEKAQRPEKTEKADRPEKTEKADRSEKAGTPEDSEEPDEPEEPAKPARRARTMRRSRTTGTRSTGTRRTARKEEETE